MALADGRATRVGWPELRAASNSASSGPTRIADLRRARTQAVRDGACRHPALGPVFPELPEEAKVQTAIHDEEVAFHRTLGRGTELFAQAAAADRAR